MFVLFKHNFYIKKTVGVSRIRTRIVGIEGEHADYLTTTTAQQFLNEPKISIPMYALNNISALYTTKI